MDTDVLYCSHTSRTIKWRALDENWHKAGKSVIWLCKTSLTPGPCSVTSWCTMRLQDVTQSVNQVDKGKRRHGKVFQHTEALLNDLGRGDAVRIHHTSVESSSARLLTSFGRTTINDVSYRMFQKGTKDKIKLSPSRKCLEQHIKTRTPGLRCGFQARCTIPEIESPILKWMVRGCYGETYTTRQCGDSSANEFPPT
ncbi:hypothetical protein GWK47_007410 [Chionoecetes opilio]|uniref:Uncharacterized protein n=1 Tax=Chionoecetes opilio TaxID=41210 RepID=A0A8J5CQQ6_CHIOP|nr:hypothetical protein GWK47_007410 [Chionoecetes opilio]